MERIRGTFSQLTGQGTIGRKALVIVAAALCLFMMAGPASAFTATEQSFGPANDPGRITVTVNCWAYDGRNRGAVDVGIAVMNPNQYSNGVTYHVQVFAKGHYGGQADWRTYVNLRTGLIKTHKTNGFVSWNEPTTIVSKRLFYGIRDGEYDVYVRYWWQPLGGSWSGPHEMPLTSYIMYDDLGYASAPATHCLT